MDDSGESDSAFIQASEHRPKANATEVQAMPLIDSHPFVTKKMMKAESHSNSDPAATEEFVKQVGNACRECGFFQVINHGVPLDRHQRIKSVSRELFQQSLGEKRKVRRDEVKIMGYYDREQIKNVGSKCLILVWRTQL